MTTSRVGDVLVEHRPGVVIATIDRPQAMNAINPGVTAGLDGAITAAADSRARVLVIRGAGGTFCAGADLEHVSGLTDYPEGLRGYVADLATVLDRLEAAPFATVAAIEGYALAGGCEILLACDIVVASTEARIGDRHLEYALLPGAGGSVRLPRTITRPRACYLLLTGDMIDGRLAADWGLATFAASPSEFEATLAGVVSRLASRSRDAVACLKRMVETTRDQPHAAAIETERQIFVDYFVTSPDVHEGLAAFRENRAPQFETVSPKEKTT